MSEPEQGNGTPRSGVDDGAHRRLAPRPLHRPPVDPGQQAVFGRPQGVPGAFSPERPNLNGHGSVEIPVVEIAPEIDDRNLDAYGIVLLTNRAWEAAVETVDDERIEGGVGVCGWGGRLIP